MLKDLCNSKVQWCVFNSNPKNASLCNDNCQADRTVKCQGVSKNFHVSIYFGHYKHDKYQTLQDGTIHLALPVQTTFSDLGHTSRSQECQSVSTKNVLILSS